MTQPRFPGVKVTLERGSYSTGIRAFDQAEYAMREQGVSEVEIREFKTAVVLAILTTTDTAELRDEFEKWVTVED